MARKDGRKQDEDKEVMLITRRDWDGTSVGETDDKNDSCYTETTSDGNNMRGKGVEYEEEEKKRRVKHLVLRMKNWAGKEDVPSFLHHHHHV